MNIFNRLIGKPRKPSTRQHDDPERSAGDWKNPVCYAQHSVCMSIPQLAASTRPPECTTAFRGCQAALRHLHVMMFKPSATEQVCNNFALKSIRGFFHDSISSWVDGSVLHEGNLGMNTGLCRWSQYIAVLADETRCDPGSIITMAAFLGHQACGIDMYDHKTNDGTAHQAITINNPYACAPNVNEELSYPADHPTAPLERREE